jgi:hypothetical protein
MFRMASDRPEQLLVVPSELVVRGNGLALDIGNTRNELY